MSTPNNPNIVKSYTDNKNKIWYEIEIECVSRPPACQTLQVGERVTVAKVKSKGLAYITAQAYANAIYSTPYHKIHIK